MEASRSGLDRLFHFSLPAGSVLVLLLLDLAPWPWPWLKSALAPCVLIALCYWAAHFPHLFGMRFSFLFGILHDLLSGQLPGVLAFSYLAADFCVRGRGHIFARGSFLFAWLAFALVVVAATALQGAIAYLFMGQPADYAALALRAVLGVLLVPLVTRLLHGLARSTLGRA